MLIIICIFTLLGAYLFGSIPTALWYGKKYHQTDIRDFGSGNLGATNTFRVLGKKAGSIVFAIDVCKGILGSALSYFWVSNDIINSENMIYIMLLHGICTVIGHIFPIFAQFKGGKGIATLLGVMIYIQPLAALVCLSIFVVVLIVSKYVSLGSMCAALSYPVLMFFIPEWRGEGYFQIYLGIALTLLVIYTHRKNVDRLLKGVENKTYLLGKPKVI